MSQCFAKSWYEAWDKLTVFPPFRAGHKLPIWQYDRYYRNQHAQVYALRDGSKFVFYNDGGCGYRSPSGTLLGRTHWQVNVGQRNFP